MANLEEKYMLRMAYDHYVTSRVFMIRTITNLQQPQF
jgi:hypothetical protein